MCEFIKITLKNSKKALTQHFAKGARNHYQKACVVLLTLAMLSGNTLCSIPIKNQPAHAAGDVAINATNFPDDNFRAYIKNLTHKSDGGTLTQAECEAVTSISVKERTIPDLTGIEYFTCITYLCCNDCKLTSLDVSHNTALTYLNCFSNQLTTLDVSNNTALTTLSCFSNQLTTLDVSHNTALTYLNCGNNHLTSLNLNPNTALAYLSCGKQTTTAPWQYDGTHYTVNMADVVGAGKLGNVSLPGETPWEYDKTTGIMTYPGDNIPTALIYNYDTGLAINSTEQLMDVTATCVLGATFYPNNGTDSFQATADTTTNKVPAPDDPTRTNYKFLGWYTSTDGGQTLSDNPYNFDTVLTSSIDLYAKWMCWIEFPAVGAIVAANDGGTFSNYLSGGDTLHVDLLDNNSDSYKSLYPQLASSITDKQITGAQIFDVYFTDESGTRVDARDFGENIEIYLKVPDGWDYDNMKAFYVTTGGAEAYSMVNEVINGVPYIHITTNHFSNYAIVNTRTTSSALATGDNSFMSICALSGLLLCTGAMLVILKKRKETMYK